jgi:hypothetical protein
MQLFDKRVNTTHITNIVELLQIYLPNVLQTQCFNYDNLPFTIEVQHTEIGHLFEHVLLEYLCQLKIAKGSQKATFAGRTSWNWIRDPKGKFYISLNCGKKDADILLLAIEKTIQLMKIILQREQRQRFPYVLRKELSYEKKFYLPKRRSRLAYSASALSNSSSSKSGQ